MVLNGEEGLEYEILVDRMQLKHVSEFKHLLCVLDDSGTEEAVSWEDAEVAGAIRSLFLGV